MKKLLLTIALILGFAATVPVYADNYYQMDGKSHTILSKSLIGFYIPIKNNNNKTFNTKHFICTTTDNYQGDIQIRYHPAAYIPNDALLNGGNINYYGDNTHIIQTNFNIKGMGGEANDMYAQPYIIIINDGCSLLDKNCNKYNRKQTKMFVTCNIIN